MHFNFLNSLNILFLALFAGMATFMGVFIGKKSSSSPSGIAFGTSFAAIIMVFISIFELIPSAYHHQGNVTIFWLLVGFVIIWFINKLLPHTHFLKEAENGDHQSLSRLSYLLAIGLILHDFPEGFVIPSSFQSSYSLGIILIIATFIHNVPEGYVMTVASKSHSGKANFYKFALYSTIATLLGSLIGVLFLSRFSYLGPIFLSIAAGAMLFISIHELIPASLKIENKFILAFGAFSAAILFWLSTLIV